MSDSSCWALRIRWPSWPTGGASRKRLLPVWTSRRWRDPAQDRYRAGQECSRHWSRGALWRWGVRHR